MRQKLHSMPGWKRWAVHAPPDCPLAPGKCGAMFHLTSGCLKGLRCRNADPLNLNRLIPAEGRCMELLHPDLNRRNWRKL